MDQPAPTRRTFLGMAAALPLAGALAGRAAATTAGTAATAPAGRPNLLILMTDQEREQVALPAGFTLPARAGLAARGVRFTSHHTPTAPCSPARSTLFTGLQAPVNGVLDNVGNTEAPTGTTGTTGQGNASLSTSIPTLGTTLRAAGYHTTYIGKWHLSDPVATTPDALTGYGFDEAIDILGGGTPNEGTSQDPGVAAQAAAWLSAHAADSQPWVCVVSFVNPHDMMFCPRFYRLADVTDYGAALPTNFETDLSSKPAVQAVWRGENEAVGGVMPNELTSADGILQWRQWGNWYLQLLRDTDQLMTQVLDTLTATGHADDTVVVQVADHGELGGAHGLRQKGAMIYQENLRVPLVIADPRRPATHGQSTAALTSHIDLVPTLAALAGVSVPSRAALPGLDLTPLLAQPAATLRDGLLVTSDAASSGLGLPGLRYCIRGVITDRYSYGRYSTPDGITGPASGFTYECYDRLTDPGELHNLGTDRAAAGLLATLDDQVDVLVKQQLQPL